MYLYESQNPLYIEKIMPELLKEENIKKFETQRIELILDTKFLGDRIVTQSDNGDVIEEKEEEYYSENSYYSRNSFEEQRKMRYKETDITAWVTRMNDHTQNILYIVYFYENEEKLLVETNQLEEVNQFEEMVIKKNIVKTPLNFSQQDQN
jgi:hypothetical protein